MIKSFLLFESESVESGEVSDGIIKVVQYPHENGIDDIALIDEQVSGN